MKTINLDTLPCTGCGRRPEHGHDLKCSRVNPKSRPTVGNHSVEYCVETWCPICIDEMRAAQKRKKLRDTLCPECGAPKVVRKGPYGRFAGCST